MLTGVIPAGTRSSGDVRSRILAVLGPTNTGKTHLALERMLGHASGMIGFPLRLLARENYDRVVRIKGEKAVALVTGEEKIIPPHPSYFICTVESMPLNRPVAFLAIDEIQLCADPERGHVFTDRLLHARGEVETMFMGADTIRPLIRRLVPGVEFVARPRFSKLAYTGQKKITRLPPRSAVVAFSAADVYSIAELIRRQRGGTAVVLGALSPRTRNAQVEMYQGGEVDYLVATDAIGMGLNMDVNHVAFAELRKFDGRAPRNLTAPELAQIAGRAGRHMNDGTFGTTGEAGPLPPDVVERIENHQFDPLRAVMWRNSDLRFVSVEALLTSLNAPPAVPGLVKAREADDFLTLQALSRDPDVADRARGPEAVRLLWEVCQIPDFRKILSDTHTRLVAQIFHYLRSPAGRVPGDWVARQVARIDRTEGDIDTLVQRIASIRTWTYVSHRPDWLEDAGEWQERARAVEDRLSDALHERLTQRFVDRRTSVLNRRLKDNDDLLCNVTPDGDVLVEGAFVGRLEGFRFAPDTSDGSVTARAFANVALRALRTEIGERVRQLAAADDAAFTLDSDGTVRWEGQAVARLRAGNDPLSPHLDPLPSDLLEGEARERVRRRLSEWFDRHLRDRFAPLFKARDAEVGGAARGIVYRLVETLGSVPRRAAESQVAALGEADRKQLARLGIRFGTETIYNPDMLRPAAVALRALLWAVHRGEQERTLPLPPAGRVSVALEPAPEGFYEAIGYRPVIYRGGKAGEGRAIRVDMLERLLALVRGLARQGPFAATPELLSLAGCGPQDLPALLEGLGYRGVEREEGMTYTQHRQGRKTRRRDAGQARRKTERRAEDSPFAKLRQLALNTSS